MTDFPVVPNPEERLKQINLPRFHMQDHGVHAGTYFPILCRKYYNFDPAAGEDEVLGKTSKMLGIGIENISVYAVSIGQWCVEWRLFWHPESKTATIEP